MLTQGYNWSFYVLPNWRKKICAGIQKQKQICTSKSLNWLNRTLHSCSHFFVLTSAFSWVLFFCWNSIRKSKEFCSPRKAHNIPTLLDRILSIFHCRRSDFLSINSNRSLQRIRLDPWSIFLRKFRFIAEIQSHLGTIHTNYSSITLQKCFSCEFF